MNIYNKKVLAQNGTLIENWYEERVIRDHTGEGRYLINIIILNKGLFQENIFQRKNLITTYSLVNNLRKIIQKYEHLEWKELNQ